MRDKTREFAAQAIGEAKVPFVDLLAQANGQASCLDCGTAKDISATKSQIRADRFARRVVRVYRAALPQLCVTAQIDASFTK